MPAYKGCTPPHPNCFLHFNLDHPSLLGTPAGSTHQHQKVKLMEYPPPRIITPFTRSLHTQQWHHPPKIIVFRSPPDMWTLHDHLPLFPSMTYQVPSSTPISLSLEMQPSSRYHPHDPNSFGTHPCFPMRFLVPPLLLPGPLYYVPPQVTVPVILA